MIFGELIPNQAAEVRRILNIYEAASGQKINLDKSVVVFSKNTSADARDAMTNINQRDMITISICRQ